ncbi:MAG: hypothetical protein J7K65_04655 [Planctomycetes bacterium]|nr:hypothetical protein [Planctomycetota bacterium]
MTNLLSFSPIASTGDTDEARSVLSRELCDLRFQKVRDHRSFHFRMNGIRLGRTMVGYNHFDTDTEVDAGQVEDAMSLWKVPVSQSLQDLCERQRSSYMQTPLNRSPFPMSWHIVNAAEGPYLIPFLAVLN